MKEILRATAVDLAAKIRTRELSSVDVVNAHLERITAVDPDIHAFLHIDSERALQAAARIDRKIAHGEQVGPLAGVPLALKDVLTYAGAPTTCGSKILAGWIPPYDATVTRRLLDADLVIGAVLVPGAKAPTLISNDLVSRMRPGSVLVDIAIDQGGCFEDSRPTTHAEPTFRVHESVFYCVANMPGAVPNTSTYALTNVTLPYALSLADRGWHDALKADPALALGLNTYDGSLTNAPVAGAHGLPARDLADVLN